MTGPATTGTLAAAVVGTPALNFTIFAFFVVVTLVIAISVARKNNSTTDYYAGGRTFTGFQNGLAIGGDYMSAAVVPRHRRAPSRSTATTASSTRSASSSAWLVALLLVAELLRNSGRYTMADAARLRMRQRPVRTRRRDARPSRLDLLPARPDGRRRCAWSPAARRRAAQPARNIVDRRRRHPDDLLRHRRRHEGHHLGADRQGRAADGRRRADHDLVLPQFGFNLSDLLGTTPRADEPARDRGPRARA